MRSTSFSRACAPWLLVACGPTAPPAGSGSGSSGPGSTGPTTEASATATTMATEDAGSSTTTGGTSTGPSCAGTIGDSTAGGTTAGVACDPDELIGHYADGDEPPIDCGHLTIDDGLDAWVAGHECALSSVSISHAFTLVAERQGIDSRPANAWGGTVDPCFGTAYIWWDDYNNIPVAIRYDCETIAAEPGCEVAVDELCLECVGQGDGIDLCE